MGQEDGTGCRADFLDKLSAAGKQALDEWVKKMGPDAELILKEYRAKIGK
jgi:hypothetical protein